MVGVCIAENTSGCSLDHQIHRLQHRHLFRKNLREGMKRNTENNRKLKKRFILKALMRFSSDSVFMLHFDWGFLEAVFDICLAMCIRLCACVCESEQQLNGSRDPYDIYFTNLNETGTWTAGVWGCLVSCFNQTVNICLQHGYSVSSRATLTEVTFCACLRVHEKERGGAKDAEGKMAKGHR